MSPPLNHGLYSNHSTQAPFRSSGLPLSSNQPTNVQYGSLPDSGNRFTNSAPRPPPRTQHAPYMYSNPYSNTYSGYGGYGSCFNRPMISNYSPYYQQSYTPPYAAPSASYDPSFIREAQESSREAFVGIEGIVNTFGSVNMMIESTYFALQSSFNAVLSVAENFSRLKSQFGQVLSAFAVLRTFQWLYRKLLYLLGLRGVDPSTDSAWRAASRSMDDLEAAGGPRRLSWPMIMFLIVVYTGPFLMWKFLASVMQRGKSKDSWVQENGDYYYAIAKYHYKAQSPEELSFSAGDYLKLAPYEKQTDKSWPLASDGKRVGIIPVNYVDIRFNSSKASNSQPPVAQLSSVTPNHHPNATVSSWAGEALRKEGSSLQTPIIPPVHETAKKNEVPVNKSSSSGSSVLSSQSDEKSDEV